MLLAIFFNICSENILDILFTFTIRQEEQNISPNYTGMTAYYSRFYKK